jgi:4-aminobutyrate aminotransferase-like enzyme
MGVQPLVHEAMLGNEDRWTHGFPPVRDFSSTVKSLGISTMNTELMERRARFMGSKVPTFYRTPVNLVRGKGVWLWGADGKRYLDCYNNVAHVGHCHPKVVEAICAQAGVLNTHTRYLHDLVLKYIEELTAKLGNGISQAIMVCSGSEANDIALRMAQAVTGKTGIIATDNTYHGNTWATSALSTRRPPIGGYPAHIRLVPAPDSLRPVGGSLAGQSAALAHAVARSITDLKASGHGFAGMIVCPIFANEGLPAVVPGFLDATTDVIRRAGGVIICDEVQPGYGRTGSHFWGHDWLGIAPDIVTVGKSIANGHPVAACLTRPDIMTAFREAFGYFSTFGGNPVSAAACLAVLNIIREEGLQEHAATVHSYMIEQLRALKHPLLAEARGVGMFFGLEFVQDQNNTPATAFVEEIVERLLDKGFLTYSSGRKANTLKVRPPLPFSIDHADLFIAALRDVLRNTPVER